MYDSSKFIKLRCRGEMKFVTSPNGIDEQVNEYRNCEAHADGGEAVTRHLHHLLRPHAGNRHQVES